MHLRAATDAVADDRLEAESLPSGAPCAVAECAPDDITSCGKGEPKEPAAEPAHWLSRLIGQGMLSIVDQGVVSGTNFVTNILLVRELGVTAFGIYVSLQNGLLLLRGVQDQLISAPFLLYAQRHSGHELARYTGSMFIHQAAAIVLTAIIWSIVFLTAWFGWLESSFILPAALLIVAGPVILSREFLRQVSFARLEVGGALTLDGSIAFVQFLGLGCLMLMGALSITSVFLVLGVAALAGLAVWMLQRPPIEYSAKGAVDDFASNWVFSRWTLASHALGSTMPLVMPWILAGVKDFSASGTLAACTTLVGVANMFVVGMCNYLCPRAARAYEDEGVPGLTRLLLLAAGVFGVLLSGFTFVAWLGGDLLPELIFARELPGGGLLLTLLAAGVLANAIGMTAGNGLWAIERPHGNFAADGVQCLVTIIATVALLPPYGEVGSAIAMLVGTSIGAVVRWTTLLWLLREESLAPRIA